MSSNVVKAAAIIAQALPSLEKFLVEQEPLENVVEQLQSKPGLINAKLSIYFLRQIASPIIVIRDEIRSRLEK